MPGNGAVFSYKHCSTSGNICGIPLPDLDSLQAPCLNEKYNLIRNAFQLRGAGSSGMLAGIQKHAAPQITVFKCSNKLT